MRFVEEYRQGQRVEKLVEAIRARVTRPWRLMEICGGQTHSIVRSGLDRLMPEGVVFVHGPGCPVCVTPVEIVDQAVALTTHSEVILCSFGDMLRVPGSAQDLLSAKSQGGDVRVIYSPLDALELARRHPDRQIVFLAVGFETTAPVHAMSVLAARQQGLENFSLLPSLFRVPPALDAMLEASQGGIQGVLLAGHVCTVMGLAEYAPLAKRHGVPMVVAGFEPQDLLEAILKLVTHLEAGEHGLDNAYARVARAEGNVHAQAALNEVFEISPRNWRGIGMIPESGWKLRSAFAAFDASLRFNLPSGVGREDPACCSGLVLQGRMKPHECAAFRVRCTPEHPLGATMVSHEGACAAYYRFRKDKPFHDKVSHG